MSKIEEIEVQLPVRINSILNSNEFYTTILENSKRDLKKLTDVKFKNFKDNISVKIILFLQNFYSDVEADCNLKRLLKPYDYTRKEVSSRNLIKLFTERYYKAVLLALQKYRILLPYKSYSNHSEEMVHSYLPQSMAKGLAMQQGNDPKKAHGYCKSYILDEIIERDTKKNGFSKRTVYVNDVQLRMLKNYYGASKNSDDEFLKQLKKQSDQVVLKVPEEISFNVEYPQVYSRVIEGDTRVRKKSIIDKRIITDHAHIKKEHLQYLQTKDGEKLAALDMSNSFAAFTIEELFKKERPKNFDDLGVQVACNCGQLYEMLMDITGEKYSRDEIKEAFMILIYSCHETNNWDGIVGEIHQALEKHYPKWLDIIQELNSKKTFSYTFGAVRLNRVKRNSYIYYAYALWESHYIQTCVEAINEQLGEIPLATRYDSILVPESKKEEALEIMLKVSENIHSIPIHVKQESLTC